MRKMSKDYSAATTAASNKARLRLGYCEEHCCKIDKCLNFNDTGSDKLCYEHSRTELHKKIKHLEDRLRGRGYESHHYDDLKCRHDKLARDYDSCLLRLNESREEIRILRSTWISEEDNRIWRKDLEDRNARLLLDLEREQRRVEHWERKAGEVLRRVDELEELLAEERLRFPPTDGYERRISELVRKVEILEEELRIERENHTLHEGRRYEVEKLLRTIADLERKLADEHIRSARVDELFKKVEILQAMLAGEREQKDILLEDIAKRDEYDRCYRKVSSPDVHNGKTKNVAEDGGLSNQPRFPPTQEYPPKVAALTLKKPRSSAWDTCATSAYKKSKFNVDMHVTMILALQFRMHCIQLTGDHSLDIANRSLKYLSTFQMLPLNGSLSQKAMIGKSEENTLCSYEDEKTEFYHTLPMALCEDMDIDPMIYEMPDSHPFPPPNARANRGRRRDFVNGSTNFGAIGYGRLLPGSSPATNGGRNPYGAIGDAFPQPDSSADNSYNSSNGTGN
ncbi:hypothetical protein K4K57_009619 [Colletotrichum sp. SAR 10_99]|nr:hypothetical protein K4K57_009619 [Colletotrichum sp. SAR 10_99]